MVLLQSPAHQSTSLHHLPPTDTWTGRNNNKWIETYICMFCNHQQDNWSELLYTAEFAHNNNHHPLIGMSPFKANNSYDMTLTRFGPTRGHNIALHLTLLKKLQEQCQLWLNKA
jgi:hypothetical protein